jgi:hypothetical protein
LLKDVQISPPEGSFPSFEEIELDLEFTIPAGTTWNGSDVLDTLTHGMLVVTLPNGDLQQIEPFLPDAFGMKNWLSVKIEKSGIGLPGLVFEAMPDLDGGLLFPIYFARLVEQPSPGVYALFWSGQNRKTNRLLLSWDGTTATITSSTEASHYEPNTTLMDRMPDLVGAWQCESRAWIFYEEGAFILNPGREDQNSGSVEAIDSSHLRMIFIAAYEPFTATALLSGDELRLTLEDGLLEICARVK